MKPGCAGALAGRRILVVEDEYFIASDLTRALQGQGAHVIGPVPDLAAGLAIARIDRIDGAVLDVNLDGETSYPIADILRARAIPFLFATGYHDETLIDAYRWVTRIEKPFDLGMMTAKLATLIRAEAEPGGRP